MPEKITTRRAGINGVSEWEPFVLMRIAGNIILIGLKPQDATGHSVECVNTNWSGCDGTLDGQTDGRVPQLRP